MMQQDSEPIADVPRFAEEIAFYLLGDSGVVFDEAAQKVYQLNTTAAYLWCRIEEGLTPPALAAALAATFGFAPPDAERHLQEALTAWRARGFLAGGPRPERAPRVVFPPAREAAPAIPGDASPCPAQPTDRRYRVLDHVYEVAVAGPEIARWVHPVLQHLACPDLPGEDAVTRVSIGPRHGGFAVARAGGPAYGCSRLDEIAPLVKQLVFSDALARTEQAVAIHAGAVSDGARALILPGPAGSGKTTLTAALAEAGLGYLTDDLVLLSRDGARVRGVPFSLTVKESGVEVLSSRFSGLEALPLHRRADGKRVNQKVRLAGSILGNPLQVRAIDVLAHADG